MIESVEVVARFDSHGEIIPVKFTWNGRVHPVVSTGRRWQDDSGEHILVMIPLDRIVELVFVAQEKRWYLKRVGMDRGLA